MMNNNNKNNESIHKPLDCPICGSYVQMNVKLNEYDTKCIRYDYKCTNTCCDYQDSVLICNY